MKTPIIPIKKADEKTINALVELGYLYMDETGIHVTEQTKIGSEEQ